MIINWKKHELFSVPKLFMLGPDEYFTLLSLSGYVYCKKPKQIRSLCLLLGLDFSADMIVIETADRAGPSLRLSFNSYFQVTDINNEKEAIPLLSVLHFVDDATKVIAAKICGALSGILFHDFHNNSVKIIRALFFGLNETKHVNEGLVFLQNNLVLTSIDIQSVEAVNQ